MTMDVKVVWMFRVEFLTHPVLHAGQAIRLTVFHAVLTDATPGMDLNAPHVCQYLNANRTALVRHVIKVFIWTEPRVELTAALLEQAQAVYPASIKNSECQKLRARRVILGTI